MNTQISMRRVKSCCQTVIRRLLSLARSPGERGRTAHHSPLRLGERARERVNFFIYPRLKRYTAVLPSRLGTACTSLLACHHAALEDAYLVIAAEVFEVVQRAQVHVRRVIPLVGQLFGNRHVAAQHVRRFFQ